jgi:hypothetical protein
VGAAEGGSRGLSDDFLYIMSSFVQFMQLQQREQEAANQDREVCYFKVPFAVHQRMIRATLPTET